MREVAAAIENIHGVRSVNQTGVRDADSYAYVVESDKGVDVRKSIFNLCASRGWAIIGLSPIGTDLESIFINLVERSESTPGTSSRKRRR